MNKLGNIIVLVTIFSFSQGYADIGTKSSNGVSPRSLVGSNAPGWIYDWEDFSKNRSLSSIRELFQSSELSPEDKQRYCKNAERLAKVLKAHNALYDLNLTGAASSLKDQSQVSIDGIDIQIDQKYEYSKSASVVIDGQTFKLGLFEKSVRRPSAVAYKKQRNQRFMDIIEQSCTEVPVAELPQQGGENSTDELRSFL